MTTASARDLKLLPGFSELLRLDRPVGTVIVGNPDVADATVQSEKTVVITAKKMLGITNIIVLDEENNELFRANIFVEEQGRANLRRIQIAPMVNRNALHDYY